MFSSVVQVCKRVCIISGVSFMMVKKQKCPTPKTRRRRDMDPGGPQNAGIIRLPLPTSTDSHINHHDHEAAPPSSFLHPQTPYSHIIPPDLYPGTAMSLKPDASLDASLHTDQVGCVLTHTDLDVQSIIASVQDGAAGATAVFIGTLPPAIYT